MSKGTRISKRWIDADGIMRACYNSYLTTGNKAYSDIIALVEAVPAADVVEVVRCKDCRWGRKVCGNIECSSDLNVLTEYHGYDWFCPNGERMEGEKKDG